MGRTVAVIWHASFSIVAAALYFFFVLPRRPELMGETSSTLGLVLRIATGVLIALAALPVVFTRLRTQRPEYGTPEFALRLRTASIVLHVLAGVLIVGAAISEIWLSLDSAGQWLFGVYGAAAAIALLGIFGFYLAFVAELPPPPPKPLKAREKSTRRGRGTAEETAEEADETVDATEAEAEAEAETADAEADDDAEPETAESETTESETKTETETETTDDAPAQVAADEPDASDSKLRNRRPANKGGISRLRRRSRGGVAVED
ncbi:hypothetical protein [Mycolicibacterium sp. XJ870]